MHIFLSDLTQNEYDYYFSLMDGNKQKRVSRYKNEIDKKRTVAGEMLARRMISKYCKVVPEDIYFETGCYGKPNAKHLNVEFNISHSEEVVVCAISDKPVGIDAEMINISRKQWIMMMLLSPILGIIRFISALIGVGKYIFFYVLHKKVYRKKTER